MKRYVAALHSAKQMCTSLHRDDRGADEGMNKLLIFGLVALPLLALLIYFGQEIVTMVTNAFQTIVGSGGVQSGT